MYLLHVAYQEWTKFKDIEKENVKRRKPSCSHIVIASVTRTNFFSNFNQC